MVGKTAVVVVVVVVAAPADILIPATSTQAPGDLLCVRLGGGGRMGGGIRGGE